MKISIIFFLLLFLTACSSKWNEQTCNSTNFNQLGYSHGIEGKNSYVATYVKKCLKHNINIPQDQYIEGYKSGLAVFCSADKGLSEGSQGKQAHAKCLNQSTYMTAHQKGLKMYCSPAKGASDGFSMQPQTVLCTSFSAYVNAYKKGVKEYCSYERGSEDGYSGNPQQASCVSYSSYTNGYKKGQSSFCSPENGTRLGKEGKTLPNQCLQMRDFKDSFYQGRIVFLGQEVKEVRTKLTFERQNYERIRDSLQDAQFSMTRFPKYSTDQNVVAEKKGIENEIARLRDQRDKQRQVVENLEKSIQDFEAEIRDLKNR